MYAISDHMVESHISVGLVAALYVESKVLLCLSYLGEENTFGLGKMSE